MDKTTLQADAGQASIGQAHRIYVLVMLLLVASANALDRHIMNILIDPIRREFGFDDGQIGMLSGLAFGLVYAIFSLPAARLADTWSRVNVITIATSIWSVATIACGQAQTGLQLFIARFFVGFGEAGSGAPSQATLGDLFPRTQRATVLGLLTLGAPIGMAGGLALGGWVLEHYGWRAAFLVAGLPGIVLAPLVFFTLPRVRPGMSDGVQKKASPIPLGVTLRGLFSTKTLVLLLVAVTTQTMMAIGIQSWLAAFFERSHHMTPSAIGAALGGALGVGSIIGHVAGGPLFDLLGKRDMRWHLWMPALIGPIAGALLAAALLGPANAAFPLIAIAFCISGFFAGPMLAIVMNLAPVAARATYAAVLVFVINAVGMGLGPFLSGRFSDLLRPSFGDESLRMALLCMIAFSVPATLLFLWASRTYRSDLAAADARNRESTIAP